MDLLTLLFVYVCNIVVSVRTDFTTLKTYSLDIPQFDPITIIEGDPLWQEKTPDLKYLNQFDTTTTSTNLYEPLIPIVSSSEEKNNEFSATALKQFLEQYAEKLKKEKFGNKPEINETHITEYVEEDKKKKAGNLLNVKQYAPLYEDKSGWVSLDPIPWSVSQISKWHSKPNPPEQINNQYLDQNPWENIDIPSSNTPKPSPYKYKPQIDRNKIEIYDGDEIDSLNKFYKRPFTSYHRPASQILTPSELKPNRNTYMNNEKDIITDGLGPDFPKKPFNFNRRHGTELYTEPHAFTGNGNWVLLSTSKGYKYPKKQRSIKLLPEFIDTHKSVQLTVLPPLKDSKINMTTSHGGLLQVESSFEPVEQAQKKFQRIQKLKNKRKRPNHLKKKRKKNKTVQTVQKSLPRSTSDSGAVLAGVGAGLIPATMAMMVPLVMNGRKRKKRSIGTGVPEKLNLL